MGKKDVNNEIDNEVINKLIEVIEENLSELKGIINSSSAGKSEKTEEPKIEVGSNVKWEDKEGEVIKIKGDVATVEDDEGDEHKVDLDDLELIPKKGKDNKSGSKKEGEKEVKIEVGAEVEWEDKDGDSHEGEVIKIKGDVATVEDDEGDEHKVDLDDLELA